MSAMPRDCKPLFWCCALNKPSKLAFALEKQGGVCLICKKPLSLGEATREHIIPVFHGGTNEQSNIGASHKRCNNDRGTAPIGYKRKWQVIVSEDGKAVSVRNKMIKI